MHQLFPLIVLLLMTPGSFAQTTVNIVANPSTTANVPMGSSSYHVSEHIFLASEINQNMTIARINFNMTTLSVTPTINSYGNVALYLKTTASATLTTGTYSLAGYTPVYSGTMAWTAA
ncbi:MAG: hypothetical protein IPN85_15845 [Flavobacteriales bacterium]|nr:hypothetical protein [Flavobacteriales bacterium]